MDADRTTDTFTVKPFLRPLLSAARRALFALVVALAGPFAVLPHLALAQSAGTANVALVGPSATQLNTVGTTFTVDVSVTPASSVTPDAAAAYVTFDAAYLKANSVTLQVTDASATYTEIVNTIDNANGTIYFGAGRLNAAWSSAFTLARIEFEVHTTIPTSASPIQLALTARDSSDPNKTDVAANGVSILGQVSGTTVSFAAPTATPTRTSTSTPTATRTPVPPSATRTTQPTQASGSTGGTTGGSTSGGTTGGTIGGTTSAPAPVVATATPVPAAPTATPAPAAASATPTPSGQGSPFGDRGRPVINFADLPPGLVPPLPAIVAVAANPVAPPFEQFYVEHQGLRVLGNTLVAPRRESGRTVQYFEKGRMEEHQDEPNPAWRFQYGLLVDELAQVKAGLPVGGDASSMTYGAVFLLAKAPMRTDAPAGFVGGTQALPDGSVFIPFSAALLPGPGHLVPGNLWSYINNPDLFPGGWLHDVGLPITPAVEAVVDKGPDKGRRILVQAFQRTILTYDPLNPLDYQIERANVGTDYARAFPERFVD